MINSDSIAREEETTDEIVPIGLLRALSYVLLGYLALMAVRTICVYTGLNRWAIVIAYFVIGITLSRVVLRRLVTYHPIFNTLQNVVTSKLWALIGWPIFYPVTIITYAIDRLL